MGPEALGGVSTAGTSSMNDRATRIFEFLVELQRLRSRVVRSLDTYRAALWYGDLPVDECVQTPGEDSEDGVWLAVDRVERDAPPTPPAELQSWVTEKALRNSSEALPTLSPRIGTGRGCRRP